MARQIALLRGINVGGNRKVPMARLRELMEALGHTDVATYVQSGNVVFTPADAAAPPEKVAAGIEEALEGAFGFRPAVTIRTREELAAVVAADPFAGVADHPSRYHVFFLSGPGDEAALAELDAAAFEPERFALRGRELYLWTPEGIGRSPLAQKLTERRIGAAATARNWRTVTTLLEMADG